MHFEDNCHSKTNAEFWRVERLESMIHGHDLYPLFPFPPPIARWPVCVMNATLNY